MMVKATNPATRQSIIITAEQAMTMKEGAACKEYQFEVLPEVETTLPPMVAPPENLPTVPPSVNLPENRSGIRKVTNAVNRRK
jgi:hypothetical protein